MDIGISEYTRQPTVLSMSGFDKVFQRSLISTIRDLVSQPSYVTNISLLGVDRRINRLRASIAGEVTLTFSFSAAYVTVSEACEACGMDFNYDHSKSCTQSFPTGGLRSSSVLFRPADDEDETSVSPSLQVEQILLDRLEALGMDTLSAVLASGELAGLCAALIESNLGSK